MKRKYADLHLCPNLSDAQQTRCMIVDASKLGYHIIGVPFPAKSSEQEVMKVRSICNEAGIDLASRVDLRPRNPDDLLRDLRRLRRRFELIAVICRSKNVARQAAKDRRVDILSFPFVGFHNRFFDRAEAELASNSLASFEIDIGQLLTLEGPSRIRLLSSLRRETAIAKGFHVPVIISSGTSDATLLRRPMETSSLSYLFDLSVDGALDAVSRNPVAIVKRNREKLSSRFVAPGIRVVRRGKDC